MVTVSKKSQASTASAWGRRNLAQVEEVRSGAGSIPACRRISHTVEAAILIPGRAVRRGCACNPSLVLPRHLLDQ
jgi:hypothetical protein